MHVMLDIETMGVSSNAAVVAIGAVIFEPYNGMILNNFYRIVDLEDAAKFGKIDPNTLKWWFLQSESVRNIFSSNKETVSLICALNNFSNWLEENQKEKNDLQIWGNGAGFDCVILRNAFLATGLAVPWNFWNERDVRTVVELGRSILNFNPKEEMIFNGIVHNALHDAQHQVQYVSAIIQLFKKKTL